MATQQQPGLGLTLQWVPGHCGFSGNEMADQQAKEVTSLGTPPGRPVRLSMILRYNTNELLQFTPSTVKQETGRRSLPQKMSPC